MNTQGVRERDQGEKWDCSKSAELVGDGSKDNLYCEPPLQMQ